MRYLVRSNRRLLVGSGRSRADDMPLYGLITRVGKGRYEVVIKFVASKRILHKEQLGAPDRDAVKQFYAREYPTLTWGEPKYRKPRVKIPRQPKKERKHAKPKSKRRRSSNKIASVDSGVHERTS
jgi:hypothetical protein